MSKKKKKIVWLCGLPEQVRKEAFVDVDLPIGLAWSWIVGHFPPPADIELHVVCADRRFPDHMQRVWNGVFFHLVNVPRGGSYFMYRGWVPAYVRAVRDIAPDVVHSWGTECGFAVSALYAAPLNHVVGIQGILAVTWPVMKKSIPLLLGVLSERLVLRKAKRCVAESRYSCRTVSRYTSAQISMVPQPLRKEFREVSPGPRNHKLVVYLGVLARRKGFFDAVEAFLSVHSDWTLVCIGEAPSKQEAEEVRSFIEEKKAGSRVVLTGSLTSLEIIEWFRKAPLFLLPSYTDTGPNALKEALSMGLWPICYDNTGPKELIERYEVGALVPTGDVVSLSLSIGRAVKGKPWVANTNLSKCIDRIRQDLSPANVWHELIGVYQETQRSR